MVHRVHRFRGGGAGRIASAWRRGDRLAAGRDALGEPLAVGIHLAELIAIGLDHAGSTDARTHRSTTEPDARGDRDPSTGDTGAHDRALRAGQLTAAADEDALVTAGVVRRIGRDLVAALLADEMKTVGVLLELGRRFERLAALAALQIQHALPLAAEGVPRGSLPPQSRNHGPERAHRPARKRDVADSQALPPGEQILDERRA